MKRQLLVLLAFVSLMSAGAHAASTSFFSNLSGAAEAPTNLSAGTGTVSIEYDDTANTLAVALDFAGLTGTATAAHIHCCSGPGANAAVALALTGFTTGVTAGTYSSIFDLSDPTVYSSSFLSAAGGTAGAAETALATALAGGLAYVNIHTSVFPGGEIRGDLATMRVPEPGAIALIGIGMLALVVARRRQP